MNSFVIGDLALISCGLTGAREKVEGSEEVLLKGPGKGLSKRFMFKDSRLVGFALVGNVANAGVLTSLVVKQADVAKAREQIIAGKYEFPFMLPLIMKNRDKFTEPEYEEVLSLL